MADIDKPGIALYEGLDLFLWKMSMPNTPSYNINADIKYYVRMWFHNGIGQIAPNPFLSDVNTLYGDFRKNFEFDKHGHRGLTMGPGSGDGEGLDLGPYCFDLTPFVQSIQLPPIGTSAQTEVETLLGTMRVGAFSPYSSDGGREITLNLLDTQYSILDAIFYPWLKMIGNAHWYDPSNAQLYRTTPYPICTLEVSTPMRWSPTPGATQFTPYVYNYIGVRPKDYDIPEINAESRSTLSRRLSLVCDLVLVDLERDSLVARANVPRDDGVITKPVPLAASNPTGTKVPASPEEPDSSPVSPESVSTEELQNNQQNKTVTQDQLTNANRDAITQAGGGEPGVSSDGGGDGSGDGGDGSGGGGGGLAGPLGDSTGNGAVTPDTAPGGGVTPDQAPSGIAAPTTPNTRAITSIIDDSTVVPGTVVRFGDGTSKTYPWKGNVTRPQVIEAELVDSRGVWEDVVEIEFGPTVTGIEYYAIARCTSLTSVVMPNSITVIGDSAFAGCTQLRSITFSASLREIGIRAFEDCTSVTSLELPMGLTKIGAWAFHRCSSLSAVSVPSSILEIGDDAFQDCSNLTSLCIKGKTWIEICALERYPWGVNPAYVVIDETTLPKSRNDIAFEAVAEANASWRDVIQQAKTCVLTHAAEQPTADVKAYLQQEVYERFDAFTVGSLLELVDESDFSLDLDESLKTVMKASTSTTFNHFEYTTAGLKAIGDIVEEVRPLTATTEGVDPSTDPIGNYSRIVTFHQLLERVQLKLRDRGSDLLQACLCLKAFETLERAPNTSFSLHGEDSNDLWLVGLYLRPVHDLLRTVLVDDGKITNQSGSLDHIAAEPYPFLLKYVWYNADWFRENGNDVLRYVFLRDLIKIYEQEQEMCVLGNGYKIQHVSIWEIVDDQLNHTGTYWCKIWVRHGSSYGRVYFCRLNYLGEVLKDSIDDLPTYSALEYVKVNHPVISDPTRDPQIECKWLVQTRKTDFVNETVNFIYSTATTNTCRSWRIRKFGQFESHYNPLSAVEDAEVWSQTTELVQDPTDNNPKWALTGFVHWEEFPREDRSNPANSDAEWNGKFATLDDRVNFQYSLSDYIDSEEAADEGQEWQAFYQTNKKCEYEAQLQIDAAQPIEMDGNLITVFPMKMGVAPAQYFHESTTSSFPMLVYKRHNCWQAATTIEEELKVGTPYNVTHTTNWSKDLFTAYIPKKLNYVIEYRHQKMRFNAAVNEQRKLLQLCNRVKAQITALGVGFGDVQREIQDMLDDERIQEICRLQAQLQELSAAFNVLSDAEITQEGVLELVKAEHKDTVQRHQKTPHQALPKKLYLADAKNLQNVSLSVLENRLVETRDQEQSIHQQYQEVSARLDELLNKPVVDGSSETVYDMIVRCVKAIYEGICGLQLVDYLSQASDRLEWFYDKRADRKALLEKIVAFFDRRVETVLEVVAEMEGASIEQLLQKVSVEDLILAFDWKAWGDEAYPVAERAVANRMAYELRVDVLIPMLQERLGRLQRQEDRLLAEMGDSTQLIYENNYATPTYMPDEQSPLKLDTPVESAEVIQRRRQFLQSLIERFRYVAPSVTGRMIGLSAEDSSTAIYQQAAQMVREQEQQVVERTPIVRSEPAPEAIYQQLVNAIKEREQLAEAPTIVPTKPETEAIYQRMVKAVKEWEATANTSSITPTKVDKEAIYQQMVALVREWEEREVPRTVPILQPTETETIYQQMVKVVKEQEQKAVEQPMAITAVPAEDVIYQQTVRAVKEQERQAAERPVVINPTPTEDTIYQKMVQVVKNQEQTKVDLRPVDLRPVEEAIYQKTVREVKEQEQQATLEPRKIERPQLEEAIYQKAAQLFERMVSSQRENAALSEEECEQRVDLVVATYRHLNPSFKTASRDDVLNSLLLVLGSTYLKQENPGLMKDLMDARILIEKMKRLQDQFKQDSDRELKLLTAARDKRQAIVDSIGQLDKVNRALMRGMSDVKLSIDKQQRFKVNVLKKSELQSSLDKVDSMIEQMLDHYEKVTKKTLDEYDRSVGNARAHYDGVIHQLADKLDFRNKLIVLGDELAQVC